MPIPIEVREKLRIVPNSEVEFQLQGNSARLVKSSPKRAGGRGAAMVARLQGTGSRKWSTDEILALMRGSDDDNARG